MANAIPALSKILFYRILSKSIDFCFIIVYTDTVNNDFSHF